MEDKKKKMIHFSSHFSSCRTKENGKREGRNTRFTRPFQTQKRPHFIFRWNKVFSILLFKISHIEDKDFYLGRDKSNLREQFVFLQKWISALGTISFILFPLPEKEEKTEKEKGSQNEKIKRKRRKIGRNSFAPFPFFSPFLFHNKE